MSTERDQIQTILSKYPDEYAIILREILQTEQEYIHRKNLQGTNIINQIVDIVKERVNE